MDDKASMLCHLQIWTIIIYKHFMLCHLQRWMNTVKMLQNYVTQSALMFYVFCKDEQRYSKTIQNLDYEQPKAPQCFVRKDGQ